METSVQKSLAVAELEPIMTDVAAFSGTVEGIEVFDEETQGQLGDLVKMMMHRRRKIEDKRTSLVGPLNKVVTDINALFKPPRDKIDGIVAAAKKKMNTFAQAQQVLADERRRQEQEAAEKERREAHELAMKLQKKAGQEAAPIVETIQAQAQESVEKAAAPAKVSVSRGREASVSTTKTWKAEVTDILALAKAVAEGRLPPNLIEPNMRALQDLSRRTKTAREVNGVRFYEHVATSVR
jgi:type I site-specific restriction endonuclease